MPRGSGRAADAARSAWSWGRLSRIAAFAVLGLALVDAGLAPLEGRIEAEAWSGQLKNAPGMAIADATRFMLLETPAERSRLAVAVVGSSVTWGPDLAVDETVPAQLAAWLAAAGQARPVFNFAQPGGIPRTSVPVASALGNHPVSLLLVEVLIPYYAKSDQPGPVPPFSSDDVALLEAASPAQMEILRRAGLSPTLSELVETALGSSVRRAWRLYRLRGSLWWDSAFTPTYLVWSLRREVAAAGFLPKRFHGQTTNIGRLPWRKAYVGEQRPGPNQRFDFPTGQLNESEYAELHLTAELSRAAGVPVIFFELPLNLAFQRAFNLMSDDDFARMDQVRSLLIERMAHDGLDFLPAPSIPDDGFLDKAHMTPLGARILAQHIGPSVVQHLRVHAFDPANRP